MINNSWIFLSKKNRSTGRNYIYDRPVGFKNYLFWLDSPYVQKMHLVRGYLELLMILFICVMIWIWRMYQFICSSGSTAVSSSYHSVFIAERQLLPKIVFVEKTKPMWKIRMKVHYMWKEFESFLNLYIFRKRFYIVFKWCIVKLKKKSQFYYISSLFLERKLHSSISVFHGDYI